ncbi:hypothetical protein ACNI2I_20605 [Enterobacter hormaechei]|uniref:hypothetical protein n=1 Tax=Enterobacter cloacae complex TaxID=354276 RepID=UPI0006D96F24|nr:hypothetical protein [Enterobacter hormaechei]EKV8997183.1 hypothetical protein [Enterobacter hormaechei]KPR17980.1 hypothetical protein AN666_15355 [Enterobacter hormaechei]MBW7732832.1 hypothetical protein [Enterobacter hormaechei]HCU0623789.1 hypothetical protein [Enterobacter hormaechei]
MNMKIAYFAATAAVLLLSACSNQPVATSEAKEVPSKQIIDRTLTQSATGTVLTVVKRDSGTKGAFCTATVAVDGKDVAEVAMSEKVSLYLAPGEHIIGARLSNAFPFCAGETAEVTANVSKEAVYRFGVNAGANFYINKTAW